MKRNPSTAYRLRGSSSTPPTESQERRRQQSRWNGNVQGATNDSAEYKPAVRIVDGYPVEYSCRDDPRDNDINDTDLKEMYVEFDYEMVTTEDADIDGSIRSLEWSLLWNVARNLGLHNCNFRRQNPSFDNNTRRLSETYVVGLSSLDFDDVDFDTDFCTFLQPDESNNVGSGSSICTPVVGKMTAQYTGDEETIRNYLTRNIEEELNSKRVRIEDVKEARFVGDREDLAQAGNIVREGLDSKNKSATNLALVVGVLAGVVVLGFVLFMARGRRRREQQLFLDSDQQVAPTSATVPNIIFQKQSLSPQSGLENFISRSSSADTEESIPERQDSLESLNTGEQSEHRTQVNVVASVIANSNVFDEKREQDTKGENHEVDLSLPETVDNKENTGVPPLPPVFVIPVDETKDKEPSKSKTLQTRRKRRKKRKKQKQRVLKRVSSRNSIDEMETIQEHDECEGYDDDDGSEFDGSEYSTDDEDDAILVMTSGDTGSKDDSEPSPKLSPGPVVPPSPIREEPRIRPLPPPWI